MNACLDRTTLDSTATPMCPHKPLDGSHVLTSRPCRTAQPRACEARRCPLDPTAPMTDDTGRLTTRDSPRRELAMAVAHKKRYTELDEAPMALSVRLRSWFDDEADILVSWLYKYRRSLAWLALVLYSFSI